MSKYILRNNFPGLFTLAEWGRKGEMTVNTGFDKVNIPLYYMRFRFVTIGQTLKPDDVMNAHLTEAEPPEVMVFAGFKYEGRGNNPLRVATSNGKDIASWAYFIDLFKATGASEESEGPAVPKDKAAGLASLAMRVGALEGSGPFEARNVLRGWAPTLAKFIAEDKAAAQSFAAALHSDAPAPGGLNLSAAAVPAAPAGPMMSLGGAPPAETPATAPQGPATAAQTSGEGNGTPAAAAPRKRRSKAEIEAERKRIEEEEREAMAADAEERGAKAAEDIAAAGR